MKKTSDYEYNELYLLGCIFFIGLFIVFYSKITLPIGSYDLNKNQVLIPAKNIKNNLYNKFLPANNRAFVEITDNNKTLCNLQDDIVSYTTEFYSIKLPYDLNYYTTKFGADTSSRHLLLAHKQLYEHLSQNGLLNQSKNNYNKMILDIEKLVSIETELYKSIKELKLKKKSPPLKKLNQKINKIKPPKGRLIVLITDNENKIIEQLNNKPVPASNEAIIIISTLNDHIVMLANKAISDYDLNIMNKGFNNKINTKPVIYNIIERIDSQLQD